MVRRNKRPRCWVCDYAVPDLDEPFVIFLQSCHHAKRGGLSAARWAEQRHELTSLDFQGELVDRHHRTEVPANRLKQDALHDSLRVPRSQRGYLPFDQDELHPSEQEHQKHGHQSDHHDLFLATLLPED